MKGHPDYFCDSMERTIDICRRISSSRCKVLFDLYHVQIMHGDVISRLRQYKEYIAHVHTAGVPGRNEIDGTQELNYPALMRTLLDMGYTGYVGQEFIPTQDDKVASLADGVRICDV
jgi:hydroxypyruvate isomerase